MYQANSEGDWSLFGDDAVKAGWADGVVHRIRETGNIKHPQCVAKVKNDHCCSSSQPCKSLGQSKDATNDDKNHLPKLLPLDYYWLYNPNNYWTV